MVYNQQRLEPLVTTNSTNLIPQINHTTQIYLHNYLCNITFPICPFHKTFIRKLYISYISWHDKRGQIGTSHELTYSAVNFNKYTYSPFPTAWAESIILFKDNSEVSLIFCHISPETVWLKRQSKMADDGRAVKSHKMALDRRKVSG